MKTSVAGVLGRGRGGMEEAGSNRSQIRLYLERISVFSSRRIRDH
jgi:hypothetical protein